jgi:hypothetical protein
MRSVGRIRWWARPLAMACAALVGGCAGVVGPTTRTAVDSGLSTLAEPQNRRAVEEILRSDEFVRATRGLTRAALDEILSGGGSDADARLTKLSSDFARDIGPALGRTLDDVVLPRVQAVIAANVRASLEQALSDENRRRVGAFSAGVARETVASVAPQVAATISSAITSAVERILERDLSPAIGKALDDHTPALSRATRAMTAAALLGVDDAMAGPFGDMFRKERQATIVAVQAAEAQQQRALVDEIEKQVGESRRWFETLVIGFGVVGLVMLGIAALLWRVLMEQRRQTAQDDGRPRRMTVD